MILKVIFVITFSLHLSAVKEKLNRISHLILLCLHGAFPVVLIHLQGDDGTAIVFLIMFIAMMFTAGLKIRYFVICVIGLLLIEIIRIFDDKSIL